jgi:hypothetical protein
MFSLLVWLTTATLGAVADVDGVADVELRHHGPPLPQTVLLIRHGEKPAKGNDLSKRGEQRAACLAVRYGTSNISHLFAYTDHPSHRPVETITPLSKALNVSIDTSIGRDDFMELAQSVSKLSENATALVCWEHDALHDVAKALGVHGPPDYPSSEFDEVWTVREGKLTQAHENC